MAQKINKKPVNKKSKPETVIQAKFARKKPVRKAFGKK